MEGKGQYCPLYPKDKTIPSPLGSALSLGEGIVVVGLGFGFAYLGRSEGDRQCVGGRDVNIVVPLYTKL